MSSNTLLKKLDPLFKENGWSLPSQEWGLDLMDLIGPSMILINDGVEQAKPFFEEPELSNDGQKQLEIKEAKVILKFIHNKLENLDNSFVSKEKALELLDQATKSCEVKKGLVMKSLRAALFGTLKGPDLIQSWVLLSRFSKDRSRIIRFT